jgi:hypothetical protein
MTVAAATPLRLSMIARLAAGRGTFRLSVQLSTVVLLVVWGGEVFGRYANAMGLCAWLVFLPTAAEKAALKVLPRMRRLTSQVAALTVRIAVLPVIAIMLALLVSALLSPGSTLTLYLAAASWSISTGLLMTISGLNRLGGRPLLDASAFGMVGGLVLAGTSATWLFDWTPSVHLAVQLGGVLAIVACAMAALPAAWVRGQQPAPRRVLPAFGRSVWLLGLSELLDAAAPSAVYLVLALSGRTTDSGPLYLALMVAAMVGSFVLYQLKLHQPATSTRLRGAGGAAGRAQATRLLRVAERAGVGFAVLTAAYLLLPGGRPLLLDATGARFYLILFALLAVEMVVSSLVLYAAFLLENTNSRVLTLTSSAALLGFVAAGLIAAVAVPVLGAAGGVAALVLAVAVKAATLRRMLRRQPATSAIPSTPKRATIQ